MYRPQAFDQPRSLKTDRNESLPQAPQSLLSLEAFARSLVSTAGLPGALLLYQDRSKCLADLVAGDVASGASCKKLRNNVAGQLQKMYQSYATQGSRQDLAKGLRSLLDIRVDEADMSNEKSNSGPTHLNSIRPYDWASTLTSKVSWTDRGYDSLLFSMERILTVRENTRIQALDLILLHKILKFDEEEAKQMLRLVERCHGREAVFRCGVRALILRSAIVKFLAGKVLN